MPDATRSMLRFGVFEADLLTRELRKGGTKIKLQEQPFQVLTTLLERPGEIVTREELRRKIWPADTFIAFEPGLNKAVNKIREALGDSAENPRFVETVPRRGYRFVAPVSVPQQEGASVPAGPVARSRMGQVVTWIAALVLLLVSFATWWHYREPKSISAVKPVVAVLPFADLSGSPGQDYFSDGITEEIITELAQLQPARLGVIARTSSMQFRHSNKNTRQIGGELGASLLLEGSVQRTGERVHITAQLIQVRDQTHLWARSYDRNLSDILGVQRELATLIANEIRLNLSTEQQKRLARTVSVNAEAYEHYLRGRYFWNRRTKDGLNKAAQHFETAIALDPGYARAYAGLADTYVLFPRYGSIDLRVAAEKGEKAALKALEIDPGMSEAYASLGYVKQNYKWDWAGAEEAYKRAIELNPNYATAHHWYGWYLGFMGRSEQSIAEEKRALELDPLSVMINATMGHAYMWAGQYDRAIEQSKKTLDLDPDFVQAHWCIGYCYVQKGMYNGALREFQQENDPVDLGSAYAAAGRTKDVEKMLARATTSVKKAFIYAELGRVDESIEWFQKTCDDRSFAPFSPLEFRWRVRLYPGLTHDSRYVALLRRLKLEGWPRNY